MGMKFEIEIELPNDELYDDIYLARKKIDAMVRDWIKVSKEYGLEGELVHILDEDYSQIYCEIRGWEI